MIRRINMCIFLLLLFFFLLFWIDISALKICADRKTAPLVSDWSSGYSGLVPNTQATAARIPPIPPRRKKRLDSIRQTNQTGQVPPSFPIQLPFFKHIFYAIISNIYIYIYIYIFFTVSYHLSARWKGFEMEPASKCASNINNGQWVTSYFVP